MNRVLMLFALIAPVPSCANGGPVRYAGGTVKLMDHHRSIRMVSEHVYIRPMEYKVKVSCTFVFQNTGRATNVKMGFPMYEGQKYLRTLRAWVDGRPARVRYANGAMDQASGVIYNWWVTTIHFKAGQTRVVRNYYESEAEADPYLERHTQYILTTGRPWRGTIGRATISLDTSAIRDYQTMWFTPLGYRRHRHMVTWILRDFEPRQNIEINYGWGYAPDLVVDGQRIGGGGLFDERVFGLRDISYYDQMETMPRITNGILMVPAQGMRNTLPVHFSESRSGRHRVFTMSHDRASLRMVPGARTAHVGRKRVRLQTAPRFRHGVLMVPFRSTIEALGFKMTHNPRNDTLYINSPGPPRGSGPSRRDGATAVRER